MAEPKPQSVAFPALSDAQIAEIQECVAVRRRRCRDGETLIGVGESDFAVYIVLSGTIDIVDVSGDEPKVFVTHHPGSFTGDISHLTGSRSVISAVARGDCEVLEVPRSSLKQMLNGCPTLSDLMLQAFIARRQLLRESPDFTGLRVIGSRYSHDTFRIRDFLARNRAIFTWTDLETDPGVDQMLKQFGITEAETPVVACGRTMLLRRNPSNQELADLLGIRQPLD